MTAPTTTDPRPRRRWRARLVIAVVAFVLLLAAAAMTWAATPLGPEPAALDYLTSDRVVRVAEVPLGYVFQPARSEGVPAAGFIMYPGGHVDLRSYAPLCHDLAARGYLVVLVRMPLSLAVLAPDRATEVMRAYPRVKYWTIGGHSLGGAMAARYAGRHLASVRGLVMLAAYPPAGTDLRASRLAIASVRGDRDGVVDTGQMDASRSRLPESTVWVTIVGGDHAGFGDYGPQPGDGEATIPASEQQQQAASAIASVIGRTVPPRP